MKTVLVDLDGPLADFEGSFLEVWRRGFPAEFFLPIEKRTKLYLTEEYPSDLKEKIESITTHEGFFVNLHPIPEGINAIKEIAAAGFNVHICSSAIFQNEHCLSEKNLWIKKYLGEDFAKSAIFTRDKTLIRGDYLIDDKPVIIGEVIPEWKHILFDQPFNKNITGQPRIKTDWSNWREIII